MTSLGQRLAAEIRAGGPIGIDRFMAVALGDADHGYYMTRDPLGQVGDFTTAPEISQIFGEILGLWCADHWQRMGGPAPVSLVELGPGRGTLMADMLRAMAVLPGCRDAVQVHFVETSPVLRASQRRTLAERDPGRNAHWHDTLASVPPGPMLLVANEFFDALPIRQWQWHQGAWCERLVGIDATGQLAFCLGPALGPAGRPAVTPPGEAIEGDIFETNDAARQIGVEIGRRLAAAPGAALIVDYGHPRGAFGDTFQAMRDHAYVDVLADPGLADLTAHVDFEALAQAIRRAGAQVWRPALQGRFLIDNGASLREAALIRGKTEEAATQIRHALRRLLDPAGMGRLFKVLAAASPGLPRPYGF